MKKFAFLVIFLSVFLVTACVPSPDTSNQDDTDANVTVTTEESDGTPIDRANDDSRRTHVKTIASAISQYKLANPDTTKFENLTICNKQKLMINKDFSLDFLVSDYLSSLPIDPENNGEGIGYSICQNNNKQIVVWSTLTRTQINSVVEDL